MFTLLIIYACGSSGDHEDGDDAERQEVKAIADEFLTLLYSNGDFAALVNTDELLHSGMNADEYINEIKVDLDYTLVSTDSYVEKVSDGLYKNYSKAKLEILENNVVAQQVIDRYTAQAKPTYFKKIDGIWYFIGNQEKVYFDEIYSKDVLYFMVQEHSSYPISMISINSNSLEIPIFYEKNNLVWTVNLPFKQSYEGEKFTVTVNYSDGTITTNSFVIPAWVERDFSINSVSKHNDGTVTVNYSTPTQETMVAGLYVNNTDVFYTFWGDDKSRIIPASVFAPGDNNIELYFYDIYNRYYYTEYTLTY
jgi:hypothetical protein